jgi:hypothetical protein
LRSPDSSACQVRIQIIDMFSSLENSKDKGRFLNQAAGLSPTSTSLAR